MKSRHIKIKGSMKDLGKKTIISAFSMGAPATNTVTDTEYLEYQVDKINSLSTRPIRATLLITDNLPPLMFDQFIVEIPKPEKYRNDPINKFEVLSDLELVQAIKALEENPILKSISDEKNIDTHLALDLFVEIFKPFAKKVGKQLAQAFTPIWNRLDESITRDVQYLEDRISEFDKVKDWNNNSTKFNKFQHMSQIIEKEYKENHEVKAEFDTETDEIFAKRKFVNAGERLKEILKKPDYTKHFENENLLKFIAAIIKDYLDFSLIGRAGIQRYSFLELAQMRCEVDTYIWYPRSPHKPLQMYYARNKIPLLRAALYVNDYKKQKDVSSKTTPQLQQKKPLSSASLISQHFTHASRQTPVEPIETSLSKTKQDEIIYHEEKAKTKEEEEQKTQETLPIQPRFFKLSPKASVIRKNSISSPRSEHTLSPTTVPRFFSPVPSSQPSPSSQDLLIALERQVLMAQMHLLDLRSQKRTPFSENNNLVVQLGTTLNETIETYQRYITKTGDNITPSLRAQC